MKDVCYLFSLFREPTPYVLRTRAPECMRLSCDAHRIGVSPLSWIPFSEGTTRNTRGSENGIILHDEEHPAGARITLERACAHAPFAITCGMYGWFFHTRFLGALAEAETSYAAMKEGIEALLLSIPLPSDTARDRQLSEVYDAISAFTEIPRSHFQR